ncbi:hypothetical protein DMENIID0001_107940 [Sergentomyia squamirostris]
MSSLDHGDSGSEVIGYPSKLYYYRIDLPEAYKDLRAQDVNPGLIHDMRIDVRTFFPKAGLLIKFKDAWKNTYSKLPEDALTVPAPLVENRNQDYREGARL